jgi:hypothetical protein
MNDVHGKFWMSTPALAVKAHASATTVGRALRQMMDDGYLVVSALCLLTRPANTATEHDQRSPNGGGRTCASSSSAAARLNPLEPITSERVEEGSRPSPTN